MRNGLSEIILHKTYSVLTYDNSQVSLAKLVSLLFLSTRNCLMCWLSFTPINEYFLIVGSIKHWKSQCTGKMQICPFYYVNIQLKCHKFA